MRNKFDMQLERLNSQLTHMGEMCEIAITRATKALEDGKIDEAQSVQEADEEIDQLEKDIERLCLKLLLQQQPVARDLRQISAALKMITDMERIGDQASDIAEIIISEKKTEAADIPVIVKMSEAAAKMVRDSVNAYVEKDLELSRAVIEYDDVVDEMFEENKKQLINYISKNGGEGGKEAIDLIMVAKYLENCRSCDQYCRVGRIFNYRNPQGEQSMIFCVEDDSNIRELVIYTLETTGFKARGFEDGKEFLEALALETPELILLDIMLPGMDGLELLSKLKASPKNRDIPVIMLTAKGAEYDKVKALDAGADDYVTKPFGMMELVSRIKAVLRRTQKDTQDPQDVIVLGDIEMNTKKHEVTADGEVVTLTLKEYELLKRLMKNPNIVMTRDCLLEDIWGYDFDGETRTVDVHVRTLRQKLGKSGEKIETVRGVGYRMSE